MLCPSTDLQAVACSSAPRTYWSPALSAMALSQKEARCTLRLPRPSVRGERRCAVAHPGSGAAGPRTTQPPRARTQADIQMMLAAQCHLGTKCVHAATQCLEPSPKP